MPLTIYRNMHDRCHYNDTGDFNSSSFINSYLKRKVASQSKKSNWSTISSSLMRYSQGVTGTRFGYFRSSGSTGHNNPLRFIWSNDLNYSSHMRIWIAGEGGKFESYYWSALGSAHLGPFRGSVWPTICGCSSACSFSSTHSWSSSGTSMSG